MWIAGIHRGHNAGVCLLKDGEVVFSMEEERLSRYKYDDGPFLSLLKIKEYTDKIDFLVFSGQYSMSRGDTESMVIHFTGENAYVAFARKLGLISGQNVMSQVVDYSDIHHLLHAAAAFYRSGFDSAVAVVCDGSGSYVQAQHVEGFEQESIYSFNYPRIIQTLYKHISNNDKHMSFFSKDYIIHDQVSELFYSNSGGISKAYEAVTYSLNYHGLEAGKVMGLFPYGKPNDSIPNLLYKSNDEISKVNKNFVFAKLPGRCGLDDLNNVLGLTCNEDENNNVEDITTLQTVRDLAYKVQIETQEAVLDLIYKAVELSGSKKVILTGGYAMNCVANYYYLDKLNADGIELFVDPVGNDGGLAIGAALLHYHVITNSTDVYGKINSLYCGPKYKYTPNEIEKIAKKYNGVIEDCVNYRDIISLIRSKNIVALFQGRSENGPRALGNRSLLFDPTFEDGKDFVNKVKRREYFRPFAGSILHKHAHEWFDMKGLDESPFMMYAMNCNEGYVEKIPSIIHVDGTCRIQTVKREQNLHYYNLIEEFYGQTGIPILFNTSFNLGGEPLVETLDDALRTLANSEIEYLYLPEYEMLITVKNGK